ncbi:MAG TPA: hypothetical protein VFW33_00200 [Gemmataceae bacterium]|nr:hypothetical protein [Gemmataceae bacterium]
MLKRRSLILLAICLLPVPPARACDTPVYRYALESWPADNYRAAVVHRGPLSAKAQLLADHLQERAASANLSVQVIDLDQPPGDLPESLRRLDVSAGPRLVINYPVATRIEADAWSGPLTPEAVAALLDSPLRRQVVSHLRAGEIVWLLLESGTKEADESAAKVVEGDRSASPPTVVLQVRRDDPAEAVLVRLLLGSEPDLAGLSEPMAFPVFGRGRVLYALVGAGITAENVGKAAAFLGGDCSCTVKRDNPGTDLLLTAEWGEIKVVEGRGDPEPAVIREGNGAAPAEARSDPKEGGSRAALWVAAGFAGGLMLLTGALALRSRKSASA